MYNWDPGPAHHGKLNGKFKSSACHEKTRFWKAKSFERCWKVRIGAWILGGKFLNSWKKGRVIFLRILPCKSFLASYIFLELFFHKRINHDEDCWGLGQVCFFWKNPCGSPLNDWGRMARTFRGMDNNLEFPSQFHTPHMLRKFWMWLEYFFHMNRLNSR